MSYGGDGDPGGGGSGGPPVVGGGGGGGWTALPAPAGDPNGVRYLPAGAFGYDAAGRARLGMDNMMRAPGFGAPPPAPPTGFVGPPDQAPPGGGGAQTSFGGHGGGQAFGGGPTRSPMIDATDGHARAAAYYSSRGLANPNPQPPAASPANPVGGAPSPQLPSGRY